MPAPVSPSPVHDLRPAVRSCARPLRCRPFRLALSLLCSCTTLIESFSQPQTRSGNTYYPIKIGILHSVTGSMAFSEKPLVEATKMAIDEINEEGGLLGHPLQAVERDGGSDQSTFKTQAEDLVGNYGVPVIFGCWTSTSRLAVEPVVEKHQALLYYPVQYEGESPCPNVFYLGSAPNQQIVPAVEWALKNANKSGAKKRVYLVGSDYVFPRKANKLIRSICAKYGATVVGETYVPIEQEDFSRVVAGINAARPSIIFNTLNGSSNYGFFFTMASYGPRQADAPVLSFSIAEPEVRLIGTKGLAGDFAAWNYFEDVESPEADEFRARWAKQLAGASPSVQGTPTSDPVEAAYIGVRLYADAVRRAGSMSFEPLRKASKGLVLSAPDGLVRIDPETQHLWKTVRIGQVNAEGNFVTLSTSDRPIRPIPLPKERDFSVGLALPSVDSETTALKLSTSRNAADRIAAVRFFSKSPPKDGSRPIVKLLRDPDWGVKAEAFSALLDASRSTQDVIDAVEESRDPDDVLLLLTLVQHLRGNDPAASGSPIGSELEAWLLAIAQNGDGLTSLLALRLLDEGSSAIPLPQDTLRTLLLSNDLAVRSACISLLHRIAGPDEATLQAVIDAVPLRSDIAALSVDRSLILELPKAAAAWRESISQTRIDWISRAVSATRPPLRATPEFLRAKEALADLHPAKRPFDAFLALASGNLLPTLFAAGILIYLSQLTFRWVFLPLTLITYNERFQERIQSVPKEGPLAYVHAVIGYLEGSHHIFLSRRVLQKWTEKFSVVAHERLTIGQRSAYYELPVEIQRPAPARFLLPGSAEFKSLLAMSSWSLSLVGEGGNGKTSLAVELAKEAAQGNLTGKPIVPVILQPERTSEGTEIVSITIDDAVQLFAAIQEALMVQTGVEHPLPDKFVRKLISSGRLLVVLDDVKVVLGPNPSLLLRKEPSFASGRLICTSRSSPNIPGEKLVKLNRVEGDTLSEFLSFCIRNAQRDKYGLGPGAAERELPDQAISDKLFRLRRMSPSMPALFVQLYALNLLSEINGGSPLDRSGVGLEGIVRSYIASLVVPLASPGIHTSSLMTGIGTLAWESFSAGFFPEPISKERAENALKSGAGLEVLETLARDSQIVRWTDQSKGFVEFAFNPIAEYLAAAHVLTRLNDGERNEVIQKLRALTSDGDENAISFARAIEDVLRSRSSRPETPKEIGDLLVSIGRQWERVKIGVLHSLTGTMSISEDSLVVAAQMAADELNEEQLIPGHEVELVIADGQSNHRVFAREATRLITAEDVQSIFGCWTSVTRMAVRPVVELHGNLLWYPVQYEGYEHSKNIIYTGSAPNQQIIPALDYFIGRGKVRPLFVGSDYHFPRTANRIAEHVLQRSGVSVVCEPIYIALGSRDVSAALTAIQTHKPDFIFSTLNGDTNIQFFAGLADARVSADDCPVVSMSIAEEEVRRIGPEVMRGHYASWGYFQSLPTSENREFIPKWKKRKGLAAVADDPIVTAYTQVRLFGQACRHVVQSGQSLTPGRIRDAALGQEILSPLGLVKVHEGNQHLFRRYYLGRVNADGQFSIEDQSQEWISPEPDPFPLEA